MRRLICNEFLSLNAFGFVFYNRHDFLRLQRFDLVLFVLLVFDLVLFAFDLVLLVFLAPPLGLESNILIIAADFFITGILTYTKWVLANVGSKTFSNPINLSKNQGTSLFVLSLKSAPAYGFAVMM